MNILTTIQAQLEQWRNLRKKGMKDTPENRKLLKEAKEQYEDTLKRIDKMEALWATLEPGKEKLRNQIEEYEKTHKKVFTGDPFLSGFAGFKK